MKSNSIYKLLFIILIIITLLTSLGMHKIKKIAWTKQYIPYVDFNCGCIEPTDEAQIGLREDGIVVWRKKR